MSTHTQLLYHIIFSTKNRESVIVPKNKERLLKYIWGIIKNQKSVLYRINAEKDYIHILTHIHPTVALSDFVKKIKTSSTTWIKTCWIMLALNMIVQPRLGLNRCCGYRSVG